MANPTTNYGWVLPTPTDLVTDLPADFDVALQGVDTTTKALNPSTTLGDIEYRSATANTNTRLGIGSTGNILTVAGGVPTWAAPAAAASGLTLIVSTAFTNVASATFDSVFTTTYRSYLVVFDDLTSSSEADDVLLQFRYGSTTQTSNYYGSSILGKFDGGTVTQTGSNSSSSLLLAANLGDSSVENGGFFMVRGADGSTSSLPTVNGQWATQGYQAHFGGGPGTARAYSGFVITSTANITGRISIYGLAK
jgi:hypothetical protein